MADLIEERARRGKNFGVILVPEGLIEFIEEVKRLIGEINYILGKKIENADQLETHQLYDKVKELLTPESALLLDFLPKAISE